MMELQPVGAEAVATRGVNRKHSYREESYIVTNRRKHAFATVVVLAAALGAGSALAMAQGDQSTYGPSTSAQSATTEESSEASQPQAMDSSQATTQSQNDGSMLDENASSDDSDNSALSSDTADTDSDMATEPNTARAYGPSASASSTSTVESAAPDEVASAMAPAPVYESVPAYIAPPNSPRYTPETGDAEYGSKLDPVGPQSNRFNDATGQ